MVRNTKPERVYKTYRKSDADEDHDLGEDCGDTFVLLAELRFGNHTCKINKIASYLLTSEDCCVDTHINVYQDLVLAW